MMYHGMKNTGIGPASTVAVMGLQPYGLGAVVVAKMMAARVVAFDASAYRRDQAAKLGSDVLVDSADKDMERVIDDLTHGEGFEHIVECDDPAIPFETMFRKMRPGGTLNLMGHARRTFEFDPNWVTLWEVQDAAHSDGDLNLLAYYRNRGRCIVYARVPEQKSDIRILYFEEKNGNVYLSGDYPDEIVRQLLTGRTFLEGTKTKYDPGCSGC